MMSLNSKIFNRLYVSTDKSWHNLWLEIEKKDYFENLFSNVEKLYANKTTYPRQSDLFKAFELTSFKNLKVVILGQDPYHGKGQANGLSFSVNDTIQIPPSLKNIFKEINSSLNLNLSEHGDLTLWSKRGVLLLNSVLTVEHSKAGSHSKIGWQQFSDDVLSYISAHKKQCVFMLWGSYAHKKIPLILNQDSHLILKSVHPSPLSAYRGFLGCDHFINCNSFLKKHNLKEINWDLSI